MPAAYQRHYRKPCANSRRGFSLVVALAMMSILVLLLVSLATLLRTEIQASASMRLREEAQRNALLALHEAMAHVQKLAGPDQRVTAAADILPSTHPAKAKLTGVWDTREYLPVVQLIPITDN